MGKCQSKDSTGYTPASVGRGRNSGDFGPPQGQTAAQNPKTMPTTPLTTSSSRDANGPSSAPQAKEDEAAAPSREPKRPTLEGQRGVTPSIREKLINLHAKAHEAGSPDSPAARKKLPQERLKIIFASPLHMVAGFVAPVHPKSPSQTEFIDAALSGNFIFSALSRAERNTLVDAMEFHSVSPSTTIIRQNDIGDYFYILQAGHIDFFIDGQKVGDATPGQSFGELALLYNCPRAATCISTTSSQLWRVDQDTFRKILASHTLTNEMETLDILKKIPFLTDLDDKFLSKMVHALTPISFVKGESIIQKGSQGKVFYIIQHGKVKVHDIQLGESNYADQFLGPGEYFGERALVTSEPRAANVTAEEDTKALCLSREMFTKFVGPLGDLVVKSGDRRKLNALPLFQKSNIEKYEYDTLASLIQDKTYPAGTILFGEGETVTNPALYLVRKGKVTITLPDGTLHTISNGGFFGENFLQKPTQGTSHISALTTVVEDSSMGILPLSTIESVIYDLNRIWDYTTSKHDSLVSKLDTSIQFASLKKHRILGVGTFGKVWLVTTKIDGEATTAYAMKVQRKRELIKHNQVSGVIREKNIMAALDHPFIIKLVNPYQDDSCIYMLIKLVQGGELFSVIHSDYNDAIDEKDARFYASAIMEGLSYMHHRHILYRDLKPENVLIDRDGYTVIVDLGFAKIVVGKTYTLCGTPLYLAPEVILSRGHDKGADHWSWGVLLYEMITGATPFYDSGIDQITLFKRIVHGRYKFNSPISPDAQDLIKRILVPRPTERLGSFAMAEMDIKTHPWLSGINYSKLVKKEYPAPWKPKVKDEFDVSNFDNWDHMETPGEHRDSVPIGAREQMLFSEFGGYTD